MSSSGFRKRASLAATLGVALATVGLSTAPTAAAGASAVPSACEAQKLPLPDNAVLGLVNAADPSGENIFGRSYPDNPSENFVRQVLRWHRGVASKIDFPGIDQAILSVNNAGIGVGVSSDESFQPTAYLYSNGAVVPLPGGTGAEALDINTNNVIVGARGDQALLWASPASEPIVLEAPAGMSARAQSIADDGTVVGFVYDSQKLVAYMWGSDRTGRPLPTLPSAHDVVWSIAHHVRNGWVTGIDNNDQNNRRVLQWNLRTNQVAQVSGIDLAQAVSPSGWMVGRDPGLEHAVLIAGDRTVQLPDVFTHMPGHLSNTPTTISDDGLTIAGQANDTADNFHPVVWQCH